MTDRRFGEILDEYVSALEAGNAPDRETLLATHPDLAEELQAALLGIDFVRCAAPRLAPEQDADAQPGRSLGDYRLLRELGRGGMAVVYEAEQVSLGRHVALKVLPFAAVLDSKHLQRFKNEAMAAAHLHHPNIVPVYGVGCERGVHYYAMQYVEGQSLATAIADMKGGGAGEGPRTPISSHGSNREAKYIRMGAAIGIQAAEALDHAHQLGIVHRDVKPGNLLVDHAGTLWITDFGLSSSIKDVGLTITGELLGTIRYMSPEQALAKRVPVDHRTDVYSLGATLYELFTLEPAFPGEDPHVVIQDIALKEPVLPRRLNPALPRDLETVILKAMSKDPGGRYATAQEMADDLGRFLENRPVEAKRPGPFRRVTKWSRRHRALVGAATGMLLLAVAGLVIGTALLWREKERTGTALEGAEANFKRAEANLALALRALDEIYVDEAEGHPKIREGLPKDLLQKGLGFYEGFVKENAGNKDLVLLMGSAYQRAGLIFRELGEDERAVESFDRAISAYDRAIEIDPRDANAHNGRGNALRDIERLEEALAAYDRAIEIDPRDARARIHRGALLCDRLGRPEEALAEFDRVIDLDPRSAVAHANRGIALVDLRRVVEALAACDRAIEVDQRYALAHAARGIALVDLGRVEEALAAYDRAIEIDPRYAEAHNSRGTALRELGRLEEAVAAHDRAIEINPRDVLAHYNRGNSLKAKGEIEAAIASYREAIRLCANGQGGAHASSAELAQVHVNLGIALDDKGDPDGAIASYHEAIRLKPDLHEAHHNLGNALRNMGQVDAAIAEFREAIRIKPDFVEAHVGLGNALTDKGQVEAAIASYREAVRIKPDHAEAHYSLGNALNHTGDPDGAIAELREAIRIKPDHAEAYVNLGIALDDKGDPDSAIASFQAAIRLKPDLYEARLSLGNALGHKGDLDGAIASFREAIRLKPDLAVAHYNLGNALRGTGATDAAIASYREAIRLEPDHAEAHLGIGDALARQGHFQEALRWLRKGHEIGSKRPGWPYPSKEWVASAELQAELENRLDRVLSGERTPRDAPERIEFALMLNWKARHAESARMYAEAFAEDAALAGDLAEGHRYNAACSASLEAARGGADAAEWRGRALEWLRADLAAREKAPSELVATLEHWKQDSDLAAVRDCLDELPKPESEAWQSLWAAVDRALAAARPASK